MAAAATATSSFGFVNWEEVFVSSDKGRREVHYYLKREDGSSDLAVIGKEKSLRHMSYHYAFRNRSLFFSPNLAKLKSRREVVDWLSSVVSGTCTLLFLAILNCFWRIPFFFFKIRAFSDSFCFGKLAFF